MTLTFFSPQSGAAACDVSLLDVLSEFIDANADTVYLMTGSQETELEWSAHCDYLRALQRLGHQTLARHNQRMAAPPLALAAVSGSTRHSPGAGRPPISSSVVRLVPLRRSTPGPNRPGISAHSRLSRCGAIWSLHYRARITDAPLRLSAALRTTAVARAIRSAIPHATYRHHQAPPLGKADGVVG